MAVIETNTSKQCNHIVRIQNNEYEVKCVKAVLSKVKRIIKGKLLLKVNEKSFHSTNSSKKSTKLLNKDKITGMSLSSSTSSWWSLQSQSQQSVKQHD